jgi:peroxiredoxin
MNLLTFAIELYFAVMLGISGFAKINNPAYFVKVLVQQKLLPGWSIVPVSKIFPWLEISIAFLLIVGVEIVALAILVLVLFATFLGIKIVLFVRQQTSDCGCLGSARPEKIDSVSITVSAITLLFAVLHLILVSEAPSIFWLWRFMGCILFVVLGIFLIRRIIIGRNIIRNQPNLAKESDNSSLFSVVGGIDTGEQAPPFEALDQEKKKIRLDDFWGKRLVLAFIIPGCPACPGTLKALNQVLQDQQNLVGLVVGGPDFEINKNYIKKHHIHFPFLTPYPDLAQKLYQVNTFPTVFIIDESGIIRARGLANRREHLQILLKVAQVGGIAS